MSDQRLKTTHTKVRSGCGTCKIRRVKCDEAKPSCKKCTSTGRKCEGYSVFRFVVDSRAITPRVPPKRMPSTVPLSTDAERTHLDFFLSRVLKQLLGDIVDNDFESLSVQLLTSETSVRGAVLALSSMQRAQLSGGQVPQEACFALVNYGESMKDLAQKLDSPTDLSRTEVNAVVLTCMLLACFDLFRQSFSSAMVHIRGGFTMLRKALCSTEKCLIGIYERLDVSISGFTGSKPQLVIRCTPQQDGVFQSISEAREALTEWIGQTVELYVGAQDHCVSPLELEQIRVRQSTLQQKTASWFERFRHMPPSQAVGLLWTQALTYDMILNTVLAEGRECVFDDYLPVFQRITDLADIYVRNHPAQQTPSNTNPEKISASAFSVEMGVLAPLFWVVHRCRDPTLRRRAIAITSSVRHREGPWDARFIVMCMVEIVKQEEAAAVAMSGRPVLCAADIPQAARSRSGVWLQQLEQAFASW